MPFAGLTIVREVTRNPHADGMALSVICAQNTAALTPAAMSTATRGTFLRDDRAQASSARAPSGRTPRPTPTPPRPCAPRCPPCSSRARSTARAAIAAGVAKGLPNSTHVVVANVAHVPANPCVHGIVAAFLKDGSSKGLDTACAAKFPPVRFATSMPKVQ
jgi:hypothetical protein